VACLIAVSASVSSGYGFFKLGEGFWLMRPSATREAYALKADIKDILHRDGSNHVILMGVGDISSYPATFFRCQLVFAGMPIGLAPNSVMDLKNAHLAIPSLTPLRENLSQRYPGKSLIWLIPKGARPFSYFFDDKFRAEFNLDYVRIESTPCFDLYGERTAQP
jgi:hypothetical protein